MADKAQQDEPITIDHSVLNEIWQWWLLGLDRLERLMGKEPRTSELRKLWKHGIIGSGKKENE